MGTSPDSSELWGPPGGQRGIALTQPRLGQGVPEKDRERGNTHHSRLREMSGERWRSPSPLERRREPTCQSRGSISYRVSAPNVRFFLVANEIKTAKAKVVQRMNFIASTLGRGPATRERALSGGRRARGRAARVFIGHRWGWGKSVLESRGRVLLGTAGGEESR